MAVTIFYDGECPFCSSYVTYLRLKEAVGHPKLVDLRADAQARARFQTMGLNVDKGMVADIDGVLYWGSDALHALALITGPAGAFNRISGLLFSSPALSSLSYPLLRAGRCLTLDLLGRKAMAEQDGQMEAKFQLFSLFFGLFSIFHVLSYPNYYHGFPPSLDFILLLALGAGLLLRPTSSGLFIALMAMSLVSGYLNAPVDSNHTILRNYLALGFVLIYAVNLLRGLPWLKTFLDFSLLGRASLLVMYVFGIFHKLNTGFLDPQVSCAVVLWRLMPTPLSMLDNAFFHYAAIYGTFIVEGAILVALLFRRSRHLAVAAGIFFHLLLSLSNFSTYLPFTTLAICLHLLFLTPDGAWRVLHSPVVAGFLTRSRQPIWMATAALYLTVMALLVVAGDYTTTTLMASVFVLPLCYAIIVYGAPQGDVRLPASQRAGGPGLVVGLAVAAIFFASCLTPYMGLKTAQSMNMFSNLRTEGGVSNHLIFSSPPSLFNYLDDVVVITKATGSIELERLAGLENTGIVRYELLRKLRANPDAVVSFRQGGVDYTDQSAATLGGEIQRTLFAEPVNKFFNFIEVKTALPPPC